MASRVALIPIASRMTMAQDPARAAARLDSPRRATSPTRSPRIHHATAATTTTFRSSTTPRTILVQLSRDKEGQPWCMACVQSIPYDQQDERGLRNESRDHEQRPLPDGPEQPQ